MARFTCDRYPSLVVMSGSGVVARFRDGVCSSRDSEVIAALARTPDVHMHDESPKRKARDRDDRDDR